MTNEAALAFERDVVIRTAATHDQFAFFYGSPTEFLGEEDYEEDEEVESVEDPQLLAYNESLDELYAFNGSTWQLWNY